MKEDPLDVPELAATVERLERGLARGAPPAGLVDRILAEVEAQAPAGPASPGRVVVPLRASRRRTAAVAAGAAALAAAAAVALTIGLTGGDDLGTPEQRAAISPAPGSPSDTVHGEAELFSPDAADGVVRLTLRDVPAPASGHHYEVWVLREGGGAMESVGSFTPAGDTVELELPLPGPGAYVAVDVSVEEDGGPAEHSETSLAAGRFA